MHWYIIAATTYIATGLFFCGFAVTTWPYLPHDEEISRVPEWQLLLTLAVVWPVPAACIVFPRFFEWVIRLARKYNKE